MRGEKSVRLALMAAAWAAAPSFGWAQVVSDGSAAPNYLGAMSRPDAGTVRTGTLPHYLGTKMPTIASNGIWVGGADGNSFSSTGSFINIIPGTWNVASNWDSNVVPTGGGFSTIASPFGPADPVENFGDVTVELDTNISLAGHTVTNLRSSEIVNNVAPSTTITTSATGLVLSMSGYVHPFTGEYDYFGARIMPAIVGAGSVTVSGSSRNFPLILGGANTFSGGLRITNGGVVSLTAEPDTNPIFNAPFRGDAALGAAGASVTLDGGTIQTFSLETSVTPITFARPFVIGPGGGTFNAGVPLTFNGNISGAGTVTTTGFDGNQTFNTSMSYTGQTVVQDGTLVLSGSGAINNSPVVRVSGTLLLNGSGANRIGDAANVILNGTGMQLAANYTETIGTLTLGGGQNTVTANTSPSGATKLIATSLDRSNRGGVMFRAANIGTGNATNASGFLFSNGTSLLVGGGGAAGTHNISVIPFAWGTSSTSSTIITQDGSGISSLVTYGANGVRPLALGTGPGHNGAEYTTSMGAAAATDNVLISSSEAVNSAKTINALLMGSGGNSNTGTPSTLSGTGTITVTSGAILNTTQSNTISAPINFGAAEGLIMAATTPTGSNNAGTGGLLLSGPISGTNGLTRIGQGNVYLFGNSTYTGQTTIAGGRTVITGSVAGDGVTASPFGKDTSPIVFVSTSNTPGSTTVNTSFGFDNTRLFYAGAGSATFARNFFTTGDGNAGVQFGAIPGAGAIAFTGNGTVNTSLTVSGQTSFSGNLSGTGYMTDVAGSTITLSGNNAGWSGGIQMGSIFDPSGATPTATVWQVGSDTALGTGTLLINNQEIIKGINGPRVLANPIVFDPNNNAAAGDGNPPIFDGQMKFTGNVDLGSITRLINMPSTGSVEFAGTIGGGDLWIRATGSATTGFSAGTVVLSGSNAMVDRTFLGDVDPTTGAPAVPGGVLRLANSNALGDGGVEIDGPSTAIELVNNIALPDRNVFIQGTGIGGTGALRNVSGNNSMAGLLLFIADSTVGVDAGSSLTMAPSSAGVRGGQIVDITSSTTPSVVTKVGGGTWTVNRISDIDLNTGTLLTPIPLGGIVINAGTVAVGSARDTSASGGAPTSTNNTAQVKSLTIAAGATLDLGVNDMVYDYTGTSPLATIRSQLASGSAGGWTGTGITSSGARAAAAAAHKTAIGYAEASSVMSTFPGTFSGAVVPDATTMLLRYTYAGDANINGTVDLTDFTFLAANFNKATGAVWLDGDFNYDQKVDLTDFTFLASNFNQTLADTASAAPLGATVPEPATLGLLACGLASVGLRRRRRHCCA